jgi:DNA-binding MarR family transcriptional regulator
MAALGDDGGVTQVRPPVPITYLVERLERAVRQSTDRVVRRHGLTTPQFTALSILARHPGMSSAQLARRSFVTPQAANELVAALERKGLVRRRADASNLRVLEMHLTEGGELTLEQCSHGVLDLEQRMLAGLTPEAGAQLRSLLESCLGAVSAPRSGRGLPAASAP